MTTNSKIAWTHHTVNPWWGCHPVSPACEHCYARSLARRTSFAKTAFDGGPYHLRPAKAIAELAKIERLGAKTKTRQRVFVESMGDFFEDLPFLAEPRRLFLQVASEECGWIDFLFLTKRPENITRLFKQAGFSLLPPSWWLGITAENQEQYNQRWPLLDDALDGFYDAFATSSPYPPGFVSIEPMLGPINLQAEALYDLALPDWIIVGCEKIGNRPGRPMVAAGVADLVRQCDGLSIPLFVKQTPTADGKHVTDDPLLFPGLYPCRRDFPPSLCP